MLAPVEKDKLRAVLAALLDKDELPACFGEAYQVFAVVALLMEKDVLGEIANNAAHQIARFYGVAGQSVEAWTADLAAVYQEFQQKMLERAKAVLDQIQKAQGAAKKK